MAAGESEDQYESSTRTFSNANRCRAVTYLFYRIDKCQTVTYSLVGIDDSGVTGRSFGAVAMPVHVFIDRNGTVRTYRIGEMNPAQIEAAINGVLKN